MLAANLAGSPVALAQLSGGSLDFGEDPFHLVGSARDFRANASASESPALTRFWESGASGLLLGALPLGQWLLGLL